MEYISFLLIILALLEMGVMLYPIFGIFTISIRDHWKKFIFIVLGSVIVALIIRVFYLPHVFMMLGILVYFSLCMKYIFKLHLVPVITMVSFILLLYLFLEIVNITVATEIIEIELETISDNFLYRIIAFLPQALVMILLGCLFRQNIFQNKIKKFIEIELFNYFQTEGFKWGNLVRTLYLVTFFLVFQTLILLSFDFTATIERYYLSTPFQITPFYRNIFLVSLMVIMIYLFFRLIRVFKLEHERVVEKIKEKNTQKMNKELRRQFHDLNQHFSTLNVMLQMEKVEEAREYLRGFIGELTTIRQNINTGNSTLDALLYSKVNKAQEEKLNFQVDVINKLDKIPVLDWELSRIVGNLIDNAFEALTEIQNEKKVEVLFYQKDYFNVIEVQTWGIMISKEEQKQIFKEGYTRKESGHGLGLYICKKLVGKYNGKIFIKREEEPPLTSFVVRLPKEN